MNKIKLKAMDGVLVETDVKIAKYFGIISNLLQHFVDLDLDQIIDVKEINSIVLKRMVEWAEHHMDHETYTNDMHSKKFDEIDESVQRKLTDIITAWEKEFLKVDIETLFLYLRAANYLEIDDLRDIIVRVIANMLIGKSADEIRRRFHEIETNKLTVI